MSKKFLTFILLGLAVSGSIVAYLLSDSTPGNTETTESFVDENQEIDWEAIKKKTDNIVKEMEADKASLQKILESRPVIEQGTVFEAPTLPEKIEFQLQERESIDLVEQPELGVPTLNPDAAIKSASKQTGLSEQEIRDLLK